MIPRAQISVFFTAILLGLSLQAEDAPAAKVSWYSELGQAATDTREKKLPLLLMFELPEQAWSRQLLVAFDDEKVRRAAQAFIAVRLNSSASTNQKLVEQFAIQILPDLRIFNVDGKQIAHASGQLSAAELAKFLSDAQKAQPEANAPALSMFFSGNELDELLQMEQQGKLPGDAAFSKLIGLAAGRNGETQIEAQRLLRKWSPALSGMLASELAHKNLKRRLVAFEMLKALEAPLESYDPWQAPAEASLVAKLKPWAEKITAERAANPKSDALTAAQKEQMEIDLRLLSGEDSTRAETARQRLVGLGKALVPILRERARTIAAQEPGTAVRYDELRYRLLISGETLRRQPGITMRLVRGGGAWRATEFERVFQSGDAGLDDLLREAACDRDAEVRAAVLRNAALAMKDPDAIFRDALHDSAATVRNLAVQTLTLRPTDDNKKALENYFKTERDAQRPQK